MDELADQPLARSFIGTCRYMTCVSDEYVRGVMKSAGCSRPDYSFLPGQHQPDCSFSRSTSTKLQFTIWSTSTRLQFSWSTLVDIDQTALFYKSTSTSCYYLTGRRRPTALFDWSTSIDCAFLQTGRWSMLSRAVDIADAVYVNFYCAFHHALCAIIRSH